MEPVPSKYPQLLFLLLVDFIFLAVQPQGVEKPSILSIRNVGNGLFGRGRRNGEEEREASWLKRGVGVRSREDPLPQQSRAPYC